MQNRRTFIKNYGALTLGSLLFSPAMLWADTPKDIGLQLYTLRDAIEKDLEGTLKKVAAIGYKNLESAMGSNGHYYGRKPAEFKKLLKEMGLKLRSSHVLTGIQKEGAPEMKFATLSKGLQKLVDDAAEADQSYLVCAYLMPYERETLDDYKRLAELCNEAGEACNDAGIQFAYHNHDFELMELEGEIPYELLLSHTDPELVKMELDLYWVAKSGHDPVMYFKKHPGRFPLWHVKDMEDSKEQSFTEVGNGVIDFKGIFQHAGESGMEYFFVEQDVSDEPFKSVAISYNHLKEMNY